MHNGRRSAGYDSYVAQQIIFMAVQKLASIFAMISIIHGSLLYQCSSRYICSFILYSVLCNKLLLILVIDADFYVGTAWSDSCLRFLMSFSRFSKSCAT